MIDIESWINKWEESIVLFIHYVWSSKFLFLPTCQMTTKKKTPGLFSLNLTTVDLENQAHL